MEFVDIVYMFQFGRYIWLKLNLFQVVLSEFSVRLLCFSIFF